MSMSEPPLVCKKARLKLVRKPRSAGVNQALISERVFLRRFQGKIATSEPDRKTGVFLACISLLRAIALFFTQGIIETIIHEKGE
jgi:hypothetical protein